MEQRDQYVGDPPRPVLRVAFRTVDGDSMELMLLADTGNPFAAIIGITNLERLKRVHAPGTDTSFGRLEGGWISIEMPDFGLSNTRILAYANDDVVAATKESDQRFEGLAGLPLLRLFEFGGNADEFWIRSAAHV